MSDQLPPRRYTSSLENYWQEMFNDLSCEQEEHSISGWSAQGLALRLQAYLEVLPSLGLPAGARILDLGCRAGAYSRILADAGHQVLGVDFAHKVLLEALQRLDGQSIDFVSADAYKLPFSSRSFDHVLCIGLLQSLHTHQMALAEMHRVLKPGAPICLMTLNRRNLIASLNRKLGMEEIVMVNDQPQPRLSTYDPQDLARDLQAAGFARVQTHPVQIYPSRLSWIKPGIGFWNHLPWLRYLSARSVLLLGYRMD